MDVLEVWARIADVDYFNDADVVRCLVNMGIPLEMNSKVNIMHNGKLPKEGGWVDLENNTREIVMYNPHSWVKSFSFRVKHGGNDVKPK